MAEVRTLCHTINMETTSAYKVLNGNNVEWNRKYGRDWRIFLTEEFNDLYVSPVIVRVIKLRRVRWAGHVVHVGERIGAYWVLVGKFEGKGTVWKT